MSGVAPISEISLAVMLSRADAAGCDWLVAPISEISLTVILALVAIVVIAVAAAVMLWKTLLAGEYDVDRSCGQDRKVGGSLDESRSAATENMDDPTVPLDDTLGTLRDFSSADTIESDGE